MVPGDDRKDVVEVVSDTAGEVTDRLELLGTGAVLLHEMRSSCRGVKK